MLRCARQAPAAEMSLGRPHGQLSGSMLMRCPAPFPSCSLGLASRRDVTPCPSPVDPTRLLRLFPSPPAGTALLLSRAISRARRRKRGGGGGGKAFPDEGGAWPPLLRGRCLVCRGCVAASRLRSEAEESWATYLCIVRRPVCFPRPAPGLKRWLRGCGKGIGWHAGRMDEGASRACGFSLIRTYMRILAAILARVAFFQRWHHLVRPTGHNGRRRQWQGREPRPGTRRGATHAHPGRHRPSIYFPRFTACH